MTFSPTPAGAPQASRHPYKVKQPAAHQLVAEQPNCCGRVQPDSVHRKVDDCTAYAKVRAMPGGFGRICKGGSTRFQGQPVGPGRISAPVVVGGSLCGRATRLAGAWSGAKFLPGTGPTPSPTASSLEALRPLDALHSRPCIVLTGRSCVLEPNCCCWRLPTVTDVILTCRADNGLSTSRLTTCRANAPPAQQQPNHRHVPSAQDPSR